MSDGPDPIQADWLQADLREGEFADADSPIYLDHNATTPVMPEVFEAMRPWLTHEWGNPSSQHVFGRRAAAAVATAREQVAELIGAQADEIVFCGNGSEADNLALLGFAEAHPSGLMPPPTVPLVLSSAMEHPAVAVALERLVKRYTSWKWHTLSTTAQGRVDLADLDRLHASGEGIVQLASFMLAHNETGAIQPVAQLVDMLRGVNERVVVHSDAAQAAGKIDVDVQALGVDSLTVVGHKFGAPKGVAALYLRRGITLSSQLLGGGQERGIRAGTEAVAQVVALGAASAIARVRGPEQRAELRRQRELFWSLLAQEIPGLHRTIREGPSLPNTLHVCVPQTDGRELLRRLVQLAASTGSACHATNEEVPGVLGQMGLSASLARGALRLSLGSTTRDAQLRRAAGLLAKAADDLR